MTMTPDRTVAAPQNRAWAVSVLMSNSWFRDLPDDLVAALMTAATIAAVPAETVIHYEGQPSTGLYAVLSGSVKMRSLSADGLECVFRYMSPGSWFGEIGMLDGSARTHDAVAVDDTLLLTLAPRDLTDILERHPLFYKFLALLLCRVIRTAFTMLNDGSLLSVSARLAKRLVSFAEASGATGDRGAGIDLHLTQDDLASVIGTSRQTINKRLVDWQRLGWIETGYGRILVRDIGALRRLARDGT